MSKLRFFSLVLIIFVPRLVQLDLFLTPDEPLFLQQAQQFQQFLETGDTSHTLGIGYPNLPLTGWASLALNLTATQQTNGLMPYVVGRFANGILTGLLLLAMYGLAGRLLSHETAWLGVALLALDPFTLGYSRLFHLEVSLALFMTLSGLAYLVWLQERRFSWLVLTAGLTSLAILTKSTALLLIPMLLVTGLTYQLITSVWFNQGEILRHGIALIITILVFTLFWPAMWTQPFTALNLTFGKLITDQAAGAGNLGMFWLGQFVEDPGPLFYPVAFLLKATPWLLLGLGLSMWQRKTPLTLSMGLFTLTYLLIMTVASKKAVRYLLPAIPMLYLLTAIALEHYKTKIMHLLPAPQLGLLVLNICLLIPYSPYYLTYYNPVVLGWVWAPSTLLVGWGEGLDQAANYLNQLPQHEPVAAWYDNLFREMYQGEVTPLDNLMTVPHTVFYLNQVQRNIPDPNLVRYFQTRRQPEHVVRLNGLDYAWIYPSVAQFDHLPHPQYPLTGEFGGEARLLGYDLHLKPPELIVTLYWQALTAPPSDRFIYVRLIDEQGQIRAKTDSPPVMGFWPTTQWQPHMVIEDAQALTLPPDLPPAAYRLEVGMYNPTTGQPLPASGQPVGAGGGLLLGTVETVP